MKEGGTSMEHSMGTRSRNIEGNDLPGFESRITTVAHVGVSSRTVLRPSAARDPGCATVIEHDNSTFFLEPRVSPVRKSATRMCQPSFSDLRPGAYPLAHPLMTGLPSTFAYWITCSQMMKLLSTKARIVMRFHYLYLLESVYFLLSFLLISISIFASFGYVTIHVTILSCKTHFSFSYLTSLH